MKAVWKDKVLAESDDTVVVEGNHYFPADSLNDEFFASSEATSICPWKGTASYFDIIVGENTNPGAAFVYRDPKPAAEEIRERVAFWNGVEVTGQPPKQAEKPESLLYRLTGGSDS